VESPLPGLDGVGEALGLAVEFFASFIEDVRGGGSRVGHLTRKIFRLPASAGEESVSAAVGANRTKDGNPHADAYSEGNRQQREVLCRELAG
jgi:hypothetical protein